MACRKLHITDFFCFAEVEKIIDHEVTDLYFAEQKINYDKETGLVYYNSRYYSPELGRWLSRDSIGEKGGVNLYAMVGNGVVNHWDMLGFYSWDPRKWWKKGVKLAADLVKLTAIVKTIQQILFALISNITATRHIPIELGPKTCFGANNHRVMTALIIEKHAIDATYEISSPLKVVVDRITNLFLTSLETTYWITDIYYYRVYSCKKCCKNLTFTVQQDFLPTFSFPPRKKMAEKNFLNGLVSFNLYYNFIIEKIKTNH